MLPPFYRVVSHRPVQRLARQGRGQFELSKPCCLRSLLAGFNDLSANTATRKIWMDEKRPDAGRIARGLILAVKTSATRSAWARSAESVVPSG